MGRPLSEFEYTEQKSHSKVLYWVNLHLVSVIHPFIIKFHITLNKSLFALQSKHKSYLQFNSKCKFT
jgi:hypothetical protein